MGAGGGVVGTGVRKKGILERKCGMNLSSGGGLWV